MELTFYSCSPVASQVCALRQSMISRNTNVLKNTNMAIDHSAVIHVTPVTTWSRQSYCYCGMQQLEAQITTCAALGNEDGGAWLKAFGSLLISITYVSFVSNYNLLCLRAVSQSSWLKSWSHLRPSYQEMISSLKDLNIKSFPLQSLSKTGCWWVKSL